MVVHALHVAGRKVENPGFEILSPEKIHAPLSLLPVFGRF
jgi:hypothetical protein